MKAETRPRPIHKINSDRCVSDHCRTGFIFLRIRGVMVVCTRRIAKQIEGHSAPLGTRYCKEQHMSYIVPPFSAPSRRVFCCPLFGVLGPFQPPLSSCSHLWIRRWRTQKASPTGLSRAPGTTRWCSLRQRHSPAAADMCRRRRRRGWRSTPSRRGLHPPQLGCGSLHNFPLPQPVHGGNATIVLWVFSEILLRHS